MKITNKFIFIRKMMFSVYLFCTSVFLSGCNENQGLINNIFQGKQTELTPDSIVETVSRVTDYLIDFAAIIASIFFIYGGVLYISSFGDTEKMEKGKKTVMWAIIGAIIVVCAKLLKDVLSLYIINK